MAKEIKAGTSAAAHPEYLKWATQKFEALFEGHQENLAAAAKVSGASVHRAFAGDPSRSWGEIAEQLEMPPPYFPVRSPEEAEAFALIAELHDLPDRSAFLRILDAARLAASSHRDASAADKILEDLGKRKRR